MTKYLVSAAFAVALVGTGLSGCTQMPTERHGVVDLRPQLSFRYDNDSLESARIIVDGLDMGAAGDYRDGKSSLRLLSGTHIVRVVLNGRTIVEEKIYAGDGVNRSILVK